MTYYLLTPIYATTTQGVGATPVVHYFAREWVKMGNSVIVFHFSHRYPFFYYIFSRLFQHQLNTHLGMLVPVNRLKDKDYVADGVYVHRRGLNKILPHSRFAKNEIRKAVRIIKEECSIRGVPDVFIGHWDNPQLEVLCALKEEFHKPICIVFHSNRFAFEKLYGNDTKKLLSEIDLIGFRNKSAQADFEKKYGKPRSSFIAYSGVSSAFIEAGRSQVKIRSTSIHNFVFVGSLIARKYPEAVLTALNRVYPDGDYKITYIGDGAEEAQIKRMIEQMPVKGNVVFTGRIQREQIIDYLKESDVFVMISRGEIFGLVYLEAMALGVIPVGSRNEGIDGIIVDGENGFLCEAGNSDELTRVLSQLRDLPISDLEMISMRARKTAEEYSDYGVANKYLNAINDII